MSRGWLLGGHWYEPVEDLGSRTDCSWHIVRQTACEEKSLLQLWSPRPVDRELDQIRAAYLQRFFEAEKPDPREGSFGHNEHCAWFIQNLPGEDLRESWITWNQETRRLFLEHLRSTLEQCAIPRFLEPAAIRLRTGRIQIPITIGDPPFSMEDLETFLGELGEAGQVSGDKPWTMPVPLSDPTASPIRGRSQEMTYLKSIIMGMGSAGLEKAILISGEDGLGQTTMVDWSCSVAETEGLWVNRHNIQHSGEHQGQTWDFLAKFLQELVAGFEADFYTKHPETARLLAKRLPSFAFLRGGRKLPGESGRILAEELEAAILVLSFASTIQKRLIVIEHLENAEQELQEALATLLMRSEALFLFSYLSEGRTEPDDFLQRVKGMSEMACLSLNRLEEKHIFEVLEDLLGPSEISKDHLRAMVKACLGNPGLLKAMLEMAQMDGTLLWQQGRWSMSAESGAMVKVQEDLLMKILDGRMQRLDSGALAIVRSLALMEWPLETETLGKAIGIAGDPLEEAVRTVVNVKLVHTQKGRLSLADPKVQELALRDCQPNEIRRLARALLKALQEAAGRPVLSVHLQTLASDERSVLSQVMAAIDQDPPPPMEADVFVRQAMELNPTPAQRSRLWEFLSDAWSLGNVGARAPLSALRERSCYEFALEAMGLAIAALDESRERGPAFRNQMAGLLRKKAGLHLRMRDHALAQKAVHAATTMLATQPNHPEQAKLRLMIGRIRELEGFPSKGLKALEEGMEMLDAEKPAPPPEDKAEFLVELGQVQARQCQFQRAFETLNTARCILETHPNMSRLSDVQRFMALAAMTMGQPEMATVLIREALQSAQMVDDMECIADSHLCIGIFRSQEQNPLPSLRHFDLAKDAYTEMVDKVSLARMQLWRARTMAALGEGGQAKELVEQALEIPVERLTAGERGEFAFLQAEIAELGAKWKEAVRLYRMASDIFEGAGHTWWEMKARLNFVHATALLAQESPKDIQQKDLESAWTLMETLKGRVEGSGSRWLELEWHRSHGRLLSTVPAPSEALVSSTLFALGEVQRISGELKFYANALEACIESAAILLKQNEKLGAKSRVQEAYSAFQELWSRMPAEYGEHFLERPDMRRFRSVVESAGIPFALPEKVDHMAEWTPTRVTMGLATTSRESQ